MVQSRAQTPKVTAGICLRGVLPLLRWHEVQCAQQRSRLHYHLATIGYWASRMLARSPRPEGLPGDSLSFGAAVRYELPSHTTSRQNRHPDLGRNDSSCNCFSLMVTSDRFQKGLSPSITAPCPAHRHLRSSLAAGLRCGLRSLYLIPPPATLLDGTAEHTKAQVVIPVVRRAPAAARQTAVVGEVNQLPPRLTRVSWNDAVNGAGKGR